ncbi:MAG: type VII secretion protein EssB/YukC [Eubacteriales bacterium]
MERIKRSELVAQDQYDYKWIAYPHNNLLPLTITQEEEELELCYEVIGTSMERIKEEDPMIQYLVLSAIGDLEELAKTHNISLEPSNLYYDAHCNVRVKKRDQYKKGTTMNKEELLIQYKSIVGSCLEHEYSYLDILLGGTTLLKKEERGNEIFQMDTIEQVQRYCRELYEKTKKEREENEIILPVKKVKRNQVIMIILAILTICNMLVLTYYTTVTAPYNKAVIALNNSFMESDYISCIDAMERIKIEKMDSYQKYMLATAYVRSENLSQKQKDNIVTSITLRSNESNKEYWIHIGRNHIDLAIDLALDILDNQLLLYAYMKEKENLLNHQSLSGTEKSEQIEAVEAKMKPLLEEYTFEEE